MKTIKNTYEHFEQSFAYWLNRNSMFLLRVSIGIIFLWFGFLKFFPGLSPAQGLAIDTITILTFSLVTPKIIIITLATWETVIGLGFLTGKFQRITLLLLFMQMLGTFAPVFIFPNEVFTQVPYAPTLEGQYIIKNLVIISAGLVIGAKVFGKRVD